MSNSTIKTTGTFENFLRIPLGKFLTDPNNRTLTPNIPGLIAYGKDDGKLHWSNNNVEWIELQVFDQSLNTTDNVTFATVNTGQGNNLLYQMDQNVRKIDDVKFGSVDTGQGPNLLYPMDQAVRKADAVNFGSVDTGQGPNLLFAMDQDVRQADAVKFASVDTGQGPNELYAMNQNVRTVDVVTFVTLTTTVGALFPTTGGTPSILDYYEEGSFDINITGTWAFPIIPWTIRFTRVGDIVSLSTNNATASQIGPSNVTGVAGGVPTRLRTSMVITRQGPITIDNGAWGGSKITFNTDGSLLITNTDNSTFSGVGNLDLQEGTLQYKI